MRLARPARRGDPAGCWWPTCPTTSRRRSSSTCSASVPAIARMLVMVQREAGERLVGRARERATSAPSRYASATSRPRRSSDASLPGCSCPARTSSRCSWRSCAASPGGRSRRGELRGDRSPARGPASAGGARCSVGRSRGSSTRAVFAAAGIDGRSRAEELGIEDWGKLVACRRSITLRAPAKLTRAAARRRASATTAITSSRPRWRRSTSRTSSRSRRRRRVSRSSTRWPGSVGPAGRRPVAGAPGRRSPARHVPPGPENLVRPGARGVRAPARGFGSSSASRPAPASAAALRTRRRCSAGPACSIRRSRRASGPTCRSASSAAGRS